MFLSFFQKKQEITLSNRLVVGEDAFGNDVYDETNEVFECLIASGAQNSSIDGVNLVQSFDLKVYLPIDAKVNTKTRFTINGVEYKLDGLPDYKNPVFMNDFIDPVLVIKLIRKDFA